MTNPPRKGHSETEATVVAHDNAKLILEGHCGLSVAERRLLAAIVGINAE